MLIMLNGLVGNARAIMLDVLGLARKRVSMIRDWLSVNSEKIETVLFVLIVSLGLSLVYGPGIVGMIHTMFHEAAVYMTTFTWDGFHADLIAWSESEIHEAGAWFLNMIG